jgi:endoglucanase
MVFRQNEDVSMLRKKYIFTLCLLMASIPSFAATPVETCGSLKVAGNKIVGSKTNKPVQTAGMSLYWTIWGGERFYNREVVDYLAKEWKITLIRAAMGVEPGGGYLGNPDAQMQYVKTVVDAAIANGIYVLIDWHDHNANQHVDRAKDFFRKMAEQYRNTPNVIWEIWNEPDNVNGSGPGGWDSWNDITQYANQVIPVIREYSSNLIVVGTPTWSQDVDAAAENPLSDANVAYTLHFYAGTHFGSLRDKADAALSKGVALFVTEFGLSTSDGGGGADRNVYTDSCKAWLDWADHKGLSWANWSLCDKEESSAALNPGASSTGYWNDGNISASGRWIRDRLQARPGVGDSIPDPLDTLEVPGRIEAEAYTSKSAGLQTEVTSDAGGGQDLGYSTQGCWAEYQVKVAEAGSYAVMARVASESGNGTITLKLNGSTKASWAVKPTGGWQQWVTTDASPEFALPAGPATIRVEWSGSGSSLVNLNWIEFARTGPSSTRSRIRNTANGGLQLAIHRGHVSFNVSDAVTRVAILTPAGRLLRVVAARTGRMELPLGSGMHLLRLEERSGAVSIHPIVGL